jgi:hypothetical protein
MQRILEAELLDSLSPDDPAARHSRRDLRVINRLMGNFRWFGRALPPNLRPGERVLEIGAGTGELGRWLAGRGVASDGLDLWPKPAVWPSSQAWHQADLRAFEGYDGYGAAIANLVLHQFSDADLAALGRKLRGRVRVILASEPARRRRWQVLCGAFTPIFGANYVTRHDARVSIAAGFTGLELPRALGLEASEWEIRCGESGLGAYRMAAVRRG